MAAQLCGAFTVATPIDMIHTNILIDLLSGEVVHVGTVVAGPVGKLAPKYLRTNPAHKILLQKQQQK